MKISAVLVAGVIAERKVPPRHPLQRLKRLTQFSHEILDDWYEGFLKPSVVTSWKNKFEANADRMKNSFNRNGQRCGFYDENQLPHGGPDDDRKRRSDDDMDRYNRDDPQEGTKQITTGFSKWAERYLSQCPGQRNYKYQKRRMNNWNNKLQAHLHQGGECGDDDACYDFQMGTRNFKIANYCNPYFSDIDFDDCNELAVIWDPHQRDLNANWVRTFIKYGKTNKQGHFETFLNCPWTDGDFGNYSDYTGEYTDAGYKVPENPWGCRNGVPQNLNELKNMDKSFGVSSSGASFDKPSKKKNMNKN